MGIPEMRLCIALVFDKNTLPFDPIGWAFVGDVHGSANVSFIWVDTPPGSGPALHTHPYEEVIVVIEGQVSAVVGDCAMTATGGQIVVVPANTPHSFVNSGTGRLLQVDIHASPTFVTTWL